MLEKYDFSKNIQGKYAKMMRGQGQFTQSHKFGISAEDIARRLQSVIM